MDIVLPAWFIGNGVYASAEAGIYAIVNPVGEIYVGQSKDLLARIRDHKKRAGARTKNLKLSMFRYGRNSHKYYLLKELDKNDKVENFWEWEKLCIKRLKDEGFVLMNANEGGTGAIKGNPYNKGRNILFPLTGHYKCKSVI